MTVPGVRTGMRRLFGVIGANRKPNSSGIQPDRIAAGRMAAREIGGYELIELLGAGGMGEVWRARHRLLDRDVAIKMVRTGKREAGGEDVMRARFESEARTTAALGSPHTVRVFDFGRTDEGDPFYVMELLHGCDLERLVQRFGPLPCDRAL